MRRASFVACVLFCALSTEARTQTASEISRPLTVRVIDSATGEPLPGAEASVPGTHRTDESLQTGLLRVAVLAAGDTVHIRRLGYRPVVIPTIQLADDQQFMTVGLVAIPHELSDVTIEARMSEILGDIGFFERRKRLAGFFVDPTEMVRMHPTRTSDLFERAPGARLSNASSGGRALRFSRAENCAPLVYVDGVVTLSAPNIERVGQARTFVTRANESVKDVFGETDHGIDEVGIRQIAAVEAYATAAQAPPPYNGGGSSCGVVLFWTWDNLGRKPRR